MMATANAQHMTTGRTSIVRADTVEAATQQLHNIMRINGWTGDAASIRPGEHIEHGAFRYWVDSEEAGR